MLKIEARRLVFGVFVHLNGRWQALFLASLVYLSFSFSFWAWVLEQPIAKKRKRWSRTLITNVTSNVWKLILYFLFQWIVTKLNLKIKLNDFKACASIERLIFLLRN